MQPLSPLLLARAAEPNWELLRGAGWAVNSMNGPYCVAFRGREEVVFEWRDGGWHRVGGRGAGDTF
jgi:hypothetical protein